MYDKEKNETGNQNVNRMSLNDLGLRSGMALQLRRLVEGASKTEGQLFGAVEDKGIMIGPRGPEGEDTGLTEGDVCIVRGFTGQYEFSFVSKVLQTYQKPFVYALLAYPTKVDATQVRQSMRTKTSWPVEAQSGGIRVDATLVDISLQGAMIAAPLPVAAVGGTIQVAIRAVVENEATTLNLNASICHSNRAAGSDTFYIGMAFTGLSQQDKLVLHYLTKTPQR